MHTPALLLCNATVTWAALCALLVIRARAGQRETETPTSGQEAGVSSEERRYAAALAI